MVSVPKERFDAGALVNLRFCLTGDMVDAEVGGELIQMFLAAYGYGVSKRNATDAAGRLEMRGCSVRLLTRELEGLAQPN